MIYVRTYVRYMLVQEYGYSKYQVNRQKDVQTVFQIEQRHNINVIKARQTNVWIR